ncbi:MAG TPA: MFS transporter, partial [Sphaerochaeta sp.]|nr:MFS transporter [Sphaerochaeta sp.]
KVLPVHLIGISSLALALRYFLYAITPSFGWIIFGQLLNSLCYGFFQPAAIYFIARRVKRSRRTLGMSIFTSVGMGVPAVIGSLIGGVIIQHFGYATLFGSYALVALFSFFLSRVFSPIMRTPPLEEG